MALNLEAKVCWDQVHKLSYMTLFVYKPIPLQVNKRYKHLSGLFKPYHNMRGSHTRLTPGNTYIKNSECIRRNDIYFRKYDCRKLEIDISNGI